MGTRGQRSIPAAAKLEGDLLEAKLPLRAFATLTTVMQSSQRRFDDSFQRWVQGVQAYNGVTIGWIKAEGTRPSTALARRVDCRFAAGLLSC